MVYLLNCKSNSGRTGPGFEYIQSFTLFTQLGSWKASLWLNRIPLSRAVNQRPPQPQAYCVFSFDVSPCCAYSKNTFHIGRLQENVHVQRSSIKLLTMRISVYGFKQDKMCKLSPSSCCFYKARRLWRDWNPDKLFKTFKVWFTYTGESLTCSC